MMAISKDKVHFIFASVLFVIHHLTLADQINVHDCHSYKTKCFQRRTGIGTRLDCVNFQQWSDLDARCEFEAQANTTFVNLCFKPGNLLILNSDFNISSFINLFTNSSSPIIDITVTGLRGLDITTPVNYIASVLMSLDIVRTRFGFYDKDGGLVEDCSQSMANLSRPLQVYGLSFTELEVKNDQMCAYAFHGARILYFGVVHFDTFVKRAKFEIAADQGFDSFELDSSVLSFTIDGYGYTLDDTILSKKVFVDIETLRIKENIIKIRSNLREFSKLKNIYLELNSPEVFLYSIGISWLKDVNWQYNVALNSNLTSSDLRYYTPAYLIFGHKDQNSIFAEYTFPDEDFCLFENFPHSQLIVPVFNIKLEHCTCTLVFLIQYYNLYDLSAIQDFFFYDLINKNFSKNLNSTCTQENLYEKCFANGSMQTRIDTCRIKETQDRRQLRNVYDWYATQVDLELAQFIILVVMNPLLCVFGFILNLLIVKTIRTFEKKELENRFYRFMMVNAWFNCAYCFIHIFDLMNVCTLNFFDSIYCSAIYSTSFAQYFKIYVIVLVGGTMQTGSNFTYILMTLNRYMLIGLNHSEILKSIAHASSRLVFTVVTIAGFLFSYVKIFHYGTNLGDSDQTYPTFMISYALPDNEAYSTLDAIFSLVNYLITTSLNVFIEVLTVIRLRAEMANKRSHMAYFGQNIHGSDHDFRIILKAVSMVTVNALINLVFKFPEFFLSILNLMSLIEPDALFVNSVVKETDWFAFLLAINGFFYLIPLIANFFVYYYFNKHFRHAFRAFIRRERM
jgi:hypothetical protein